MAVSTVVKGEGAAPVQRERGGGRRAAPAPMPGFNEIDLRSFGRTLWRWRAVVIWTTLVLSAVAIVFVYRLTPLYTASAQVLIGIEQVNVGKLQDVVNGLVKDNTEAVATESGVIRSRNLAEKVINKLGLDNDPEFNAALRQPGYFHRLMAGEEFIPESWIAFLHLAPPPESPPVGARDMAKIVDAFLDKLRVSNDGRSRIINISFESQNPSTAAQAVDALGEAYIVARLDAKFDATRRANLWLAERLNSLRQEVLVSEQAVEKFRAENGLERAKDTTLNTQEISQTSAEVITARTKRLEAQSRLAQLQRAKGGAVDANILEVLQSPLIQQLRGQEAEASRRAADLLSQYGDKHPKVINVRAEIADIHAKIQTEISKIVDSLRNEAANQSAREASLTDMLNKLKGQVGRDSIAEVQLRDLQRQADSNKTLYENFLSQFKLTQSQDTFEQPDANVISRAEVPHDPSFPQKSPLILLSVVASFAFGVFLALLYQFLDVGLRSMEQVINVLKVHALGMIPAPTGLVKGAGKLAREVIERPLSSFSEAVRTIHTNLLLSDVDQRPRVVLITSSLPGEGKSTVAVALSQMAARYGQKVVLIDGDLRRPNVHRLAGISAKPGLVDWLLDRASFEEIVHHQATGGVDVIPAGEIPNIPPNLLASERFKQLLRGLADHYDMVVLDSAPVLALADTRVLSVLADKTIFVLRWASTSYRVATTALRQLQDGGAYIAGAVLNAVDVKAHAKDGFSDSVLYTGKLKEYYR